MSLSMTAEDIKKNILSTLDEESQTVIRSHVIAGQKILFDKTTHDQMFDDIFKGEDDPSTKAGEGAASIMLMLFEQGKGTSLKGALVPSGAIILASMLEFTDKTGIEKVDDGILNESLQIMAVRIHDRFDGDFRNKVSQRTGKQLPANEPQQPRQDQQMQPQQQPPQQPGGLISAVGA